jgi:hypothetical protein
LRRQQLEAWKIAQPSQPALFELKTDCRPEAERTAAGRYREPTLFGSRVQPTRFMCAKAEPEIELKVRQPAAGFARSKADASHRIKNNNGEQLSQDVRSID